MSEVARHVHPPLAMHDARQPSLRHPVIGSELHGADIPFGGRLQAAASEVEGADLAVHQCILRLQLLGSREGARRAQVVALVPRHPA